VEDLDPEGGEPFYLPDLSSGQVLGAQEPMEVLMVCVDLNLVSRSFKVVTPGFECFNDGEKLAIVHVIVALGGRYLSGEESNGPPLGPFRTISVRLAQDF
jgi:hypothetical protein